MKKLIFTTVFFLVSIFFFNQFYSMINHTNHFNNIEEGFNGGTSGGGGATSNW